MLLKLPERDPDGPLADPAVGAEELPALEPDWLVLPLMQLVSAPVKNTARAATSMAEPLDFIRSLEIRILLPLSRGHTKQGVFPLTQGGRGAGFQGITL
jgi:hypothetical protein